MANIVLYRELDWLRWVVWSVVPAFPIIARAFGGSPFDRCLARIHRARPL